MPNNYGNPGSLKLSAGPVYTPDILMSEGGKAAETMAGMEACHYNGGPNGEVKLY